MPDEPSIGSYQSLTSQALMNNILLFKKTSLESDLWLGCKPKVSSKERHSSFSYNIILPNRKKLKHECEADQRMLNHQNLMGLHRRARIRPSNSPDDRTARLEKRQSKWEISQHQTTHHTLHPRRQGQNLTISFAPKVQSNMKCTSVLSENTKTAVPDKSAYRWRQDNLARTPVRG